MPQREATKAEAEDAVHHLSHQPWMPTCTEWNVIERTDGTVYVRGYMDPSVSDDVGRPRLDALPHYLSGRMMAATISHPRAWHGRYGRVRVMVSMPDRDITTTEPRVRRPRPGPPPMEPCPAAGLVDKVAAWAKDADLSPEDREVLAQLLAEARGR